jgi:hypothetical protein
VLIVSLIRVVARPTNVPAPIVSTPKRLTLRPALVALILTASPDVVSIPSTTPPPPPPPPPDTINSPALLIPTGSIAPLIGLVAYKIIGLVKYLI